MTTELLHNSQITETAQTWSKLWNFTMLQPQITHVPDVDNANVYSHRWIRMMNQWLCEMCRSTSDSVVSIKSTNHQNAQIIFLQRCFQENKVQKCFLRSLTTYKVINIKFFQISRFARLLYVLYPDFRRFSLISAPTFRSWLLGTCPTLRRKCACSAKTLLKFL